MHDEKICTCTHAAGSGSIDPVTNGGYCFRCLTCDGKFGKVMSMHGGLEQFGGGEVPGAGPIRSVFAYRDIVIVIRGYEVYAATPSGWENLATIQP